MKVRFVPTLLDPPAKVESFHCDNGKFFDKLIILKLALPGLGNESYFLYRNAKSNGWELIASGTFDEMVETAQNLEDKA